MNTEKKKKNISLYLACGLLTAVFLMLIFLNIFYGDHWLDSDMAAEMIFSKLIAEEKGFLATTNWYYSTEFRVLYTQIIMVPLFHLFQDWHVIRTITNIITYVLILCSYYYFMKPLKVNKTAVILSSVLLLLPFSETFVTHMQMGNTYMPHVIIVFFCFGMFLRLVDQTKLLDLRKLPLFILFVALSMICGMSGVRYILALQAPLLLTSIFCMLQSPEYSILRREKSKTNIKKAFSGKNGLYLLYGGISLLSAMIGYAINITLIASKYTFQTYEATNFIKVFQGVLLERIQDTIANLLMLFGYIEEKGFLSLRGLISMIAFVLLIGIIILVRNTGTLLKNVKEEEMEKRNLRRFIHAFFVIAFLLNTFVFVFTTSTIVSRYYITVFIFILPLLCFYFEGHKSEWDKTLVLILLFICMGLSTMKCVYSFIDKDKNAEEKKVAAFLEENDYKFGYASYWNANILTELTDGNVKVANISKFEDMSYFCWSSPKKYYEEGYHNDKTFLLMTIEQYETYKEQSAVQKGKEIYRDDEYIIFHYDSTEDIF